MTSDNGVPRGRLGLGLTVWAAGVAFSVAVAPRDPTAPCVSTADCAQFSDRPETVECVAIPANAKGANKYCVNVVAGTMEKCPTTDPGNQCCSDSNCTHVPKTGAKHGRCESYASGQFCGGPMPPRINICQYDVCVAENDYACPAHTESCIPRGFFSTRASSCTKLLCTTDDECRPGDVCRPFASPSYCRGLQGFFCVNPKTAECTVDSDCAHKSPNPPPLVCSMNTTTLTPECMRPIPPPPKPERTDVQQSQM